jgi:hypothetical protein
MNTKGSWVLLAFVLLAVLFVPIIPNDEPITCTGANPSCDDTVGYVSVYTKYFSHK